MAVRGSWRGIRVTGLVAIAFVLTASSCVLFDEAVWVGFSADDRHVACAYASGRLTIHDLVRGTSRDVTKEAAPKGGFAWSPAGNRLAFCVKRIGTWSLALADSSGTVTVLTRDEGRSLQPVWAPDGAGIYYASSEGGGFQGDYDIRFFDLAAGRSFPIIRGPHDQVEPRISPDGRWLAAVSYQQGNPLILVYALKSTRVIRISPAPEFRGDPLRLLAWLGDGRRLLYELKHGDRFLLFECEAESEKSEQRDASDQPFDAVALDRAGRDVLYVSGGKAWRRSTQPFWGRRRRLGFGGLSVGWVAPRHRDDQLGAVVEGQLLALASASGGGAKPLVKGSKEYVEWGDLELERGGKRQGLKYYDAAMAAVRAEHGPQNAVRENAKLKLSRAALLCRLGHARETTEYLRDAQRVLEKTMTPPELDQLYSAYAFNEFLWYGRDEAARALAGKTPPQARWEGTALLLQVLGQPDKQLRSEFRRALAALWKGKTEGGLELFLRLYQAHPGDPVAQAVFRKAWGQEFDLPGSGGLISWAKFQKRTEVWGQLVMRHYAVVGEQLALEENWPDNIETAGLAALDADGLKRVLLRFDRRILTRKNVQDSYRGYWQMAEDETTEDHHVYDVFVQAYFDPEVLARATALTTDPVVLTDIRLARARYALYTGESEEMGRALGEVAAAIRTAGIKAVFGADRERQIAFDLLQGELAERTGAWDAAVADYRKSAADLEPLLKEKHDINEPAPELGRFCEQARFRADLLQQGAKVKSELADLLAIERAVGDHLMTDSEDPTSLLNGLHNYFALLAQTKTAWVKDVIYLKAGECYRRLGRWCEAGYCLRVAASSKERFVVRCARAELSDMYRGLEDPGLANLYSPR